MGYVWRLATRGRSKATATSRMERFVIIVNGFQLLAIITKRSIWDVAVALDPPLATTGKVEISEKLKAEIETSTCTVL